MPADPSHLPSVYRRELALIVGILRHEFSIQVMSAAEPVNQKGRIVKIILFGPFASQSWAEECGNGDKSDYDLLIVVNDARFIHLVPYWEVAEERIIAHRSIRRDVRFIIHSIAEINENLQKGQCFFQDIVNQGVTLYEINWRPFARQQPLSPEAAYAEARKYANYWLTAAENRIRSAEWFLQQGAWRDCAFDLHQTAERAYHALLLTHTGYTPASHNIKHLRSLAEQIDAKLIEVWPRQLQRDRTCFELLQRAYVESRYSPHYQISDTQLNWLLDRVKILIIEARASCAARLKFLLDQYKPTNPAAGLEDIPLMSLIGKSDFV